MVEVGWSRTNLSSPVATPLAERLFKVIVLTKYHRCPLKAETLRNDNIHGGPKSGLFWEMITLRRSGVIIKARDTSKVCKCSDHVYFPLSWKRLAREYARKKIGTGESNVESSRLKIRPITRRTSQGVSALYNIDACLHVEQPTRVRVQASERLRSAAAEPLMRLFLSRSSSLVHIWSRHTRATVSVRTYSVIYQQRCCALRRSLLRWPRRFSDLFALAFFVFGPSAAFRVFTPPRAGAGRTKAYKFW